MRWHIMLGVLVLTGSSAQAERVALRDDALKQALAGRTVHLDTPFGVAIPITFHGNGLMSGKAGVLEYFLGAEADRGRWWVAEGKLCQKWFKWLNAQPSCMSLQQEGQRLFWQRDDGLSGTATIQAGLPPGAEGLGGPIQQPETRHSLTAREQREGPTHKKTAVGSAPLHRPVSPAPRTSPATTPEAQPQSAGLVHASIAIARVEEEWCHSATVERTVLAAAPNLALVARQLYLSPGIEVPWLVSACFSAEPALRAVSKLLIETR
jgi:hypothetical protein